MSIEIIRNGIKPNTKLYFKCDCGCVWKCDKEDCEKSVIEEQRDYTIVKFYCNCPTCQCKRQGMTQEEYIKWSITNYHIGGRFA